MGGVVPGREKGGGVGVSLYRAGIEQARGRAVMLRALVVLWCLLLGCSAVVAQRLATPEVAHLLHDESTPERVFFLAGEFLPGSTSTRIGFFALCESSTGRSQAGFSFGLFPTGVPVQAAVRGPDGRVARFGPVVRATPAHGFHSPIYEEAEAVRRFVDVVFVPGALVSNGHNSVFNRLPEGVNNRVRERISVCLDAR